MTVDIFLIGKMIVWPLPRRHRRHPSQPCSFPGQGTGGPLRRGRRRLEESHRSLPPLKIFYDCRQIYAHQT